MLIMNLLVEQAILLIEQKGITAHLGSKPESHVCIELESCFAFILYWIVLIIICLEISLRSR